MHHPTHCLGLLTGVTRERIRRVSCLSWGVGHPWLDNNRYDNPFWNQCAQMQTDKGHMVRCNVFLAGRRPRRARPVVWRARLPTHGNRRLARERLDTPFRPCFDRHETLQEIDVPDYWNSELPPAPMRHGSGHDGSHAFLAAEFVNPIPDDRGPAIDVCESLAMTVPWIVAHDSSLRDGEQLSVPSFDRSN